MKQVLFQAMHVLQVHSKSGIWNLVAQFDLGRSCFVASMGVIDLLSDAFSRHLLLFWVRQVGCWLAVWDYLPLSAYV